MKAACSAAGGLGQGRTGSDALPVGSRGRGRPSSPSPRPAQPMPRSTATSLRPTVQHGGIIIRAPDALTDLPPAHRRDLLNSHPRHEGLAFLSPAAPRVPRVGERQSDFGRFGRCRDDQCRGCGSAHGLAGARHRGAPRSREPPPTLIGPVYGMVAALAVSEKTSARNTRVSAKFRRLSDATARRELNIQRACGFYEYLARYRGPASVSHEDYGVSFSTISAPSDFGSGGADPTENSAASLPRALCQKNFA